MKLDKKTLLQQLTDEVRQNINDINPLKVISAIQLNATPANGGWSIAQVIEHLNTYNAYYLPVIETALMRAIPAKNAGTFSSGMLGNYFIKMMQPQNGRVTGKYKAAKRHIPANDTDAATVLKTYLGGQQQLLQLLDMANGYDINVIKIPTSISNIVKLKLGDVFRFLIAHQQRHFVQIEQIKSQQHSYIDK
jgi:hypothetical protein